jgi:hypothetical protein
MNRQTNIPEASVRTGDADLTQAASRAAPSVPKSTPTRIRVNVTNDAWLSKESKSL